MFVCAYSVDFACLGVLFLMELGLGAPYWLALVVACFLLVARGLA